jgi:hypothetical protein
MFEINSPDVLVEDFGDDVVLLNLKSGSYYNVTERAKAFFFAVRDGQAPEQICRDIDALDPQAGKDATAFFESLKEHSLIRATGGESAGLAGEDSARTILAAGSVFGLDHFDDLSDLLLADPIHDVDAESGWPERS